MVGTGQGLNEPLLVGAGHQAPPVEAAGTVIGAAGRVSDGLLHLLERLDLRGGIVVGVGHVVLPAARG